MSQSVTHTAHIAAISDDDLPTSPRHKAAGSSPTASTTSTAMPPVSQANTPEETMIGAMPEDASGSTPPATPSAVTPRAEILPAETAAKTAKVHRAHSGTEHAQQALSQGQHAPQAQHVQRVQQARGKAVVSRVPQQQQQQQLSRWHTCTMPLLLPLLAAWWALAHLLAWLSAFLVLPPYILSRRLYWACPFIPAIFRAQGLLAGTLARLGFEGAYCINVVTRLLTLPLRTSLPDFYIIGFPKAGTTSLAAYLQAHPAISGIDGLPFHDALRKESHFLAGIFGRGPWSCSSPALYRSFFPTVMTRWWAEAVVGVDKWLCFDACPTYACMPYTAARAARLTPGAKIIVMLRDPADGLFSSETMIRNFAVDLAWSLADPDQGEGDSRFQEDPSAEALWRQVCSLGPDQALPGQWPDHFYFSLAAKMQACRLDTCVGAWLDSFPREQVMAIDFKDFCREPEAVVRRVLAFVGAQQQLLAWAPQEAKMKTDYRGRRMHASVRRRLRAMFAASNRRLYALLGRDFGWEDPEEGCE